MRALIVGCGYVGRPLAEELARLGHEVFGLRRNWSGGSQATGVITLKGDITRPATLDKLPRDFDWVVNCAATGGGSAEDYRKLYVEGNHNLFVWLGATPVKKYVYTGSTSVYAQNDGSTVTEASATQPESEAALALLEAEDLLRAEARRGFPAVVLRVAGIYGPGRGYALKQFLRGEARIEGEGARHMNMIHRDDLVKVIIAALEGGRAGEIYNAADDEPVTQQQFFSWLAAKLNQPLPPKARGGQDGWRKRGVTDKRVSNQKLRTELGCELRFPNYRAGYGPLVAEALQASG